MSEPLKADLAAWIVATMELLCAVTGHRFGCWLLSWRLYQRAAKRAYPVREYACSQCGERLTEASGPHGGEVSWRRIEPMTANFTPTYTVAWDCRTPRAAE